jgi:hypothetical protein
MTTAAWQKDELVEHSTQIPPALLQLDDDDAFADGDDEIPYMFSSEAVRAEFTRTLSPTNTDDIYVSAVDLRLDTLGASMSTLDMNGNGDELSPSGSCVTACPPLYTH